ncbi:MAG: ECF-type sigma factor [Bryobacteraceae bacterium]
MGTAADVTTLLAAFARGKREAADELIPLVYDELRKIARLRRFRWSGPHSPGTTSLVHEAYVNLVDQSRCQWEDRSHFFYFASVAMRNILIDNARRWGRQKRGGGAGELPLEHLHLASVGRAEELLAVDEALGKLGANNQRLSQIVECRFFGGLTVEETAQALSISPATVKRGWDSARAWLFKELGPLPSEAPEQ